MLTWIRLAAALAASAIILTSSGCLTTGRFPGPKWLSSNRAAPVEDDPSLPDPSTLAVPSTVTQPTTSGSGTGAGQAGYQQASAPRTTTTAGAITTPGPAPTAGVFSTTADTGTPPTTLTAVEPNSYPSTNQPAPRAVAAPTAGFLPGSPAVQSGTPPGSLSDANVQQGFYGNPPAVAATESPATGSPATGSPATGSPDVMSNVATNIATSDPPGPGATVATTTWDQPASVPYPTTPAAASQMAEVTSIYPAFPANEASPPSTASVPSTTPATNTQPQVTEPSPFQTPRASPPPAVPGATPPTEIDASIYGVPVAQQSPAQVAPASFTEPPADSHYEQMSRASHAGDSSWRPGSTTDYRGAIPR